MVAIFQPRSVAKGWLEGLKLIFWINGRKFGLVRGLKLIMINLQYFEDLPCWRFSVWGRQLRHWVKVWSFLEVTNKGTRTTSLIGVFLWLWIYFTLWSGVSVVDFEQVNARWVALFVNRHRDVFQPITVLCLLI